MIDTSIQRVEINQVIENQLPEFVQAESPLFVDFMKQYYISQEYQGGSINIAENLDRYTKLQTYVGAALTEFTGLSTDTQSFSETIFVDSTKGYPNKYGLIKIDDEVITYTGIGTTSFTGCIRGFSGVTNLDQPTRPDLVEFKTSVGAAHTGGSKVHNLSNLFIREFFNKIKTTYASGFENRKFDSDLDQVKFIRQVKDFYRTKGTEESYKILFRALYGEEVNIIKPSEFLIKPSDADYGFGQDFVVKAITGDPRNLKGSTLFQDADDDDKNIRGASGAISDVKDFLYGGEHYYQVTVSQDSIDGDFVIPGRTRVTDVVSIGSTVMTVDTTVGFPTSGSLSLPTASVAGVVTYTSKTSNQFVGVDTAVDVLSVGDDVRFNNVAYGYSFANNSKKIEVLITGVLKDFPIPDTTFYFNKGDKVKVGSFGINKSSEDSNFGSWVYNTAVKFTPNNIARQSSSSFNIELLSDHGFLEEDTVEVLDAQSALIGVGRVLSVISGSVFILGDLPGVGESNIAFIRRRLKRGNSSLHDNITKYTTDVQNVYDHQSDDANALPPHPHAYVTSPSIPSLGNEPIVAPDRSVTWTGATGGDVIQLIQVTEGAADHGFYSGEVVTYNVISGFLGSLIDGKNYYVSRIDSNNIRLANSLPDLVNGDFVDATGDGTFKISVPDLANKKLDHQKLLKRISLNPLFDGESRETAPGTTGMFVNGVEISNYKSGDVIQFGGVESIDVLEGGSQYDVITPPTVSIESLTGAGVSATANVKGQFERIDIVDPGFDYVEPPVVEISGGNGQNAIARSRLKQVDHFIDFDASSTGNVINISDDTIGFGTFHKFRDGEAVVYKTFNTGAIGIASAGNDTTDIQSTPDQRLVDESVYFVSKVNNTTIKLANNKNDALTKSNLINLTGFADGSQRFQSLNKKQVLGQIIVESPGEGYENKRRLIPTVGINTYSDFLEFKNHGFEDGELIRYSNNQVKIGGLDTDQDYYVLKINDDRFRLASAGIGSTLSNVNYISKQFVGMTSVGSGDHVFNYPPISVNVKGIIGINTTHPENYHARVNPIVRGSLTSIDITNPGLGYGNDTTFNFSIPPTVRVSSGSSSEYKAIVTNGKIQSVIVTRSGAEYTSAPDLEILGDGIGAKIISSISNGRVDSVTVDNGGVGYSTASVVVQEVIPGTGAIFLPKVRSWSVNNVKRYEDIFYGDDGFLSRGDNDEGIKFTSFYAPRGLRKILKQKNSDGTIDYTSNDLNLLNNAEQASLNHSPIIGWAYDGNPIYGPYGYERKDGGSVKIMRSGYSLKTNRDGGPPISTFPLGFFTDDFEYLGNGDLDENNGRYCITPDYPNGTFAYFATINPSENETSGTFKNFRAPVFPYLIGKNYAAKPDEFNFIETNNQNLNLNTLGLKRNTNPYKLEGSGADYEGIHDSRKLVDQEIEVNYASAGRINQFELLSAGSGYQVKDDLRVLSLDKGNGFSGEISKVEGQEIISIASTVVKIENLVFTYNNSNGQVTGLSSQPHDLVVGDIVTISGLSTDSLRKLDGRHQIGFNTSFLQLNTGIGTTGTTGIVTTISVTGDLSQNGIAPNDVLGIGTERMLVLNIDNVNDNIRVKRQFDNRIGYIPSTVGIAHTSASVVTNLNRTITFNLGINTDIQTRVNIPYYFNPIESVALGESAGVGIGSTVRYSFKVVGGGSTERFIPSQNIFLQDHGFKTGEKLLYSSNGDTTIQVSNGIGQTFSLTNNSPVFAINGGRDLLGISTNPLGIGSTGSIAGIGSTAYQLFFKSHGTGKIHSFTPQRTEITGFAEKVVGTVVCKEAHKLQANDRVNLSVTPGITTSVDIQFDDTTRRTFVNPITFGASAVSTTSNTITFVNHGFKTGDKVLYKSANTINPLKSNSTYFVIRIDNDTFRLSESAFKSNKLIPDAISFTSTGSGHTIALINPPIELVRGYKVGFAVSDTSLTQVISGKRRHIFDFEIFRDTNFTNPYFNNDEDGGFQVVGVGTVGVSTSARVDLSVTQNAPSDLFYKLTPVNLNINAPFKRDPIVDTDVINYSSLKISDSGYNGSYVITGIGSTTFSFVMSSQPEKDGYTKNEATVLKYNTPSLTAIGSINDIRIISKGKNYLNIPVVTSIGSTLGVGGVVRLNSNETGKLRRYTIKNIGFDYSADKTIQPSVQLPQILRLDRLSKISNIGISSGGKNYVQPPNIVVIDRVTGLVKDEVITESDLQGTSVSEVRILRNTNSLYDTNPRIVPTNNNNGIKVKDLSFTSGTNLVTLTLEGTYTSATYPFELGKKVYVENIGIGSTGSGYNSSDYNYESFTITGVNTNPGGGNATVSYNLDRSVTSPGIFSGPSSSGQAIPFENLAAFNIDVETNQFSVGETVSTGDKVGTVVAWNENNKYLKVLSNDTFEVGESINGTSSKSIALIEQTTKFNSVFNIDSDSEFRSGFRKETGKLSTELQKLADNDYYQTFSYSLGSPVSYDTWKDPVNSLGHVVGFRNFADVSIVSTASTDDKNRSNASVGVSSSPVVVVADLVSEKESLHNSYDFDLVTENSKNIAGVFLSDEINFGNKILTDYIESRTNRAISIDSVSSQFNDLPRATAFSDVFAIDLDDIDGIKFYVMVFDTRFSGEKEIIQINLLHDGSLGYMMPFGRVETEIDLGDFDFSVTGSTGNLRFLPAKSRFNNYALRLFAVETFKNTQTGISTLSLGTGYDIISTSSGIGSTDPSPVQVVGFGTTAITTSKLFIQTQELGGDQRTQLNELVVLNDSEEAYVLDYAQMINENITASNSPNVGLGTFGADVRSGITSVYFTPTTGVGVTMRVHQVAIGGTATGIGSTTISLTEVLTTTTNIAATGTPQQTRISGINSGTYTAFDALIEIHNTTDDQYAVTQVTAIHDTITPQFVEFGYMDNFNGSGIGTVGVGYSSATGGDIELRLTPPANKAITTKVFQYNFNESGTGGVGLVTFTDSRLKSAEGSYTGTENDVKFSFDLKHTGDSIFHKTFDSSDAAVVDVTNDTFVVNNHFFQTGEELTYTPTGAGTTMSVGIAATAISGIGVTSKLPSTVFAVKIAENKFKVARTAAEALQAVPKVIDVTAVGVGTTHSFTSQNLNSKALISLDNNIQSPVIQSPINTKLSFDALVTTDFVTLTGISSIFSGDVIKVNNEFMQVDTVGIGSTNQILVKRGRLNSAIANHSAGDTVTKFLGNYQIVEDTINFTDPPKGSKGPAGLTTTSTFVGRVFTHTGVPGGSQEAYVNNFVFDTFENQFTGIATNFILKSGGSNVTGFATNTGVLLLNEIFQNPNDDYNIVETAGITSVSFTGVGVTNNYDVNVSSVPRGGIIVSVGETSSFGYQPLVAAGGTAIVSAAGTVESVSIGNSGSGYRVGLQTNILVRARGSSGIVTIGTANVSAGLVTSVTITNGGGSGFSSATPPTLEFDRPLNYENMRLVGSTTGIGASVSVRVGTASSVISFQITNFGYNYKINDVLKIEEGGRAGILTDANKVVKDFELTVLDVFNDSFAGFTFGELEKLNTFEDLFDGTRRTFPITKTIGAVETPITIRAAKGSPIRVEDNTLIFLNDILQVPFESYVYSGGSQITFSEAPKADDKLRIYYYRASDDDVLEVDILETVKTGDSLTINKYPDVGLDDVFQQEPRTVTGITTSDTVTTNTYIDAGITTVRTLERPVTWRKQTQDVFVNNIGIGKDRVELEPNIRPTAYLIKSVSAGSTEMFVDTSVPLFNKVDGIVETKQSVLILDRTTKTGVAATAVVSGTGGISTVVISDGGSGYTVAPQVSIGVTAGIGTITAGIGTTSGNATAVATVSGVGTISAITVSYVGFGYTNTNPPLVLVEPEAVTQDTLTSIKYDGDFGEIVGIGTSTVAGIGTALQLDLFIPKDSVLRDASVMGSAVTVSGIQSGYYFTVFDTNVGNGLTSYENAVGTSPVGIGTSFIDNIYKVHSAKNITGDAYGIGSTVGINTTLRRVTVSVSSTEGIGIGSGFFGRFSWGRLHDFVKKGDSAFTAINDDGITGIVTGPVIIRTRDLKESFT